MKMFELLLKLLGERPQSKRFTTMADAPGDSVFQLLRTALSFDTHTFLQNLTVLAILSPDYVAFLRRIMVKSLTIFKDPKPPRHEGLIVELIDTASPETEPTIIFLERTASSNRPDLKYFADHPNSGTVLESVICTLKAIPSSLRTSITTAGSNASLSLPIPLIDLTRSPSPLYRPLDEPESDDEPVSEAYTQPSLPWFDAVTLAGGKVLHVSTRISQTPYHADDRFVGSKNIPAYVLLLHNLRQILLKPNTLPLIDFACLAQAVHEHDPLYSLFKHHCYWLVAVVCTVTERLYPCTTVHNKRYAPVSEDIIHIPANDYLPDLAGRTMGILVSEVEEAVVSVVISNFKASMAAKRDDIKTQWLSYHENQESEAAKLRKRVAQLEDIIRVHNLDPNVNIDSDMLDLI